jgi:cysteinyl-tRNA synthetase
MPEAISVFFEFITFSNTQVDSWNLSISEANSLVDMFKTFDSVFSLIDYSSLEEGDIPLIIMKKFEERNIAKKDKNFEQSDRIREELLTL